MKRTMVLMLASFFGAVVRQIHQIRVIALLNLVLHQPIHLRLKNKLINYPKMENMSHQMTDF
ncbi:hypothetical protein BAU16_07835 [Enterococcus sp. JM9B]|nr:hypothetical protein BAU16_07835 [Enterococcus sp. JM9B]